MSGAYLFFNGCRGGNRTRSLRIMSPTIDQIDMPCDGAGNRNRTYDLCVTSALLCLLSYVGIRWTSRIFAAGATPAFPGLCVYSIQLIQMFDDALNTVDGGNGGVRTLARLHVCWFSKPVPSTSWVRLQSAGGRSRTCNPSLTRRLLYH